MAYISQESKAKIATVIKALLLKHGVKGSLSIDNHSTLNLNIKSGRLDFIGNYNEVQKTRVMAEHDRISAKEYHDVNPYWFHQQYSGEVLEFVTAAIKALKGAGWYNNTDVQSDYFDIAYYIGINIGRWDKPYEYMGAATPTKAQEPCTLIV